MDKHSRIFVAGHNGLVGSAIVRRLQADGYTNIIVRSRKETDVENDGGIVQDLTKSDAPPHKLLDVMKLHPLGRKHHIHLEAGIESSYEWFLKTQGNFRK